MRLMTNNPAKYGGIEGYGLEIVDRVPLHTEPTAENIAYLQAKQRKLGHLLDLDDDEQLGRELIQVGEYNGAEGELDATGMRFAIAVARFNQDITEALLDGAQRTLEKHDAGDVDGRVGAGRVRAAARRQAARGVGCGRRRHLPRRGRPRRDGALRVRGGRVRGRAHARRRSTPASR